MPSIASSPPARDTDLDRRVVSERHTGRIEALRLIAAELRFEAEEAARTSRDFGRGMAWAITIVTSRADDAEVGEWPAGSVA